jgi:hypothetical protein
MSDDPVEAAFRRASAALDEAWQTVRDVRQFGEPSLIETLSSNLADPNGLDVALMLCRLIPTLSSDRDRIALQIIARSCFGDALLTEAAYHRIVKDVGK